MKRHLYLLTVLLVFILTFFLRFYKLDVLPNGLNQDETALGYNAYSILLTGKDEYGHHLPLYFKSFGDYKLPVYVYLTAGAIKVFGLNEFAVRFWSAFLGSLTIIVTFFLIRDLTKRKDIPLIASTLLCINPWHLFFSRVAFEVNVANFFIVLGVFLFVKAVKKNTLPMYLFSLLSFGISLYTYNVTRLVAPALFLFLMFHYKERIQKLSLVAKSLIVVVFLGLLVPFVLTLLSKSGLSGQSAVLIFSGPAKASMLEFRSYIAQLPRVIGLLLFNNYLLVIWYYLSNVVSFFSTTFFFVSGGSGSVSVGNVGMFYIFEVPSFIVGFGLLFKNKYPFLQLFGIWFAIVLAIIGLSTGAPHATRDFTMIVPLVVISSVGLLTIWQWIWQQKPTIRKILLALSIILVAYNIFYFGFSYIYRFPIVAAKTWRAEDKALSLYLQKNESKYNKIIIDTDADFIYTSLLFYQKYDPQKAITTSTYDNGALFVHMKTLGKYEFRKVHLEKDLSISHTLIVTGDVPSNKYQIDQIGYPPRHVVLYVDKAFPQYPVIDVAYKMFTNTK